ncbi:hypothetical protein N656DRAFT_777973 [Canariomyces notabilis]|uniref:Uncharacterized protein n=1 Tax=Canariomyces notabilis TaxID=2074819 RepID=A0AAN6THD8_9PEZI|nr:hypothetical protein N656DRAFT_777973 [Canariomyces arenarius]
MSEPILAPDVGERGSLVRSDRRSPAFTQGLETGLAAGPQPAEALPGSPSNKKVFRDQPTKCLPSLASPGPSGILAHVPERHYHVPYTWPLLSLISVTAVMMQTGTFLFALLFAPRQVITHGSRDWIQDG